MKIKYTHRVVYKDGGAFFAKLDAKERRMYISECTSPDGVILYGEDHFACRDDTVEEYFSVPIGSWECTKLSTFKGNK